MVQLLAKGLAGVQPFPILADALALIEHPFWQSRLLRWRVRSTLELRAFGRRVERVLGSEGIRAHFPSDRGYVPRYVTALDGVPDGDVDGLGDAFSSPRRLFDARWLVLSLVEGRRRFRILEKVRLASD